VNFCPALPSGVFALSNPSPRAASLKVHAFSDDLSAALRRA
jgi:hypothetical protein